jgi:hypothetical protein
MEFLNRIEDGDHLIIGWVIEQIIETWRRK